MEDFEVEEMIDERIKAKLEEMRAKCQHEVDCYDEEIAERARIFARPMKEWTIDCLIASDFVDKYGFDPLLLHRQDPADEVAAIDRALEALPREYDGFRAEMIMHDGCQWISVGDPMIKRAAEKVCLDLYERGEDPMEIGYHLMMQEWFRPKHSSKGHEIRVQLEAGKSYDELMRRYNMSPAEFFTFIRDGQGETWSGKES